jgi:ATP-dependent protease Clp ATPase subunit
MEGVMTDIMYRVPSDKTAKKVIVTEESVRDGVSPTVIHEEEPQFTLELPEGQKERKTRKRKSE